MTGNEVASPKMSDLREITRQELYCDLFLKVKYLHFHISVAIQGQRYSMWEEITQEYEYQEVGVIGAVLGAGYLSTYS